jgi:hypothetical protein
LGIGKPVLAVYQAGRKVSKMISGNPDVNLRVKPYDDPAGAISLIRDFLAEI